MKKFANLLGGKGNGQRKGPLSGKLLSISDQQVEVGIVVGEGGFATVYRALDVDTQSPLALKHFRLGGDPEKVQEVTTEVSIMKSLKACPYVVRLHSVAFSGPKGAEVEAVMLMDLAVQTLPAYMQQHSFQLEDRDILHIFLPVCRAVQAMHSLSPPVTHRDIKMENCLMHANGTWQLCDFGSASTVQGVFDSAAEIAREEDVIRKTTTPAYRAPELWDLWSRLPVGPPGDIWALGCLLYLLCFGQLPFDGMSKLQTMSGRYHLPDSRPAAFRTLISRMLVTEPLSRPGIDQIVAAVERLAAAEPGQSLSRPLPAAVHAAIAAQHGDQQQTAQHAQHSRSMSKDWKELASSRPPSQPALNAAAPPPPPTTAAGITDGFAGWASFDSPQKPAGLNPQPQLAPGAANITPAAEAAAASASAPLSAPMSASAASRGVFWERFGHTEDVESELVSAGAPGAARRSPTIAGMQAAAVSAALPSPAAALPAVPPIQTALQAPAGETTHMQSAPVVKPAATMTDKPAPAAPPVAQPVSRPAPPAAVAGAVAHAPAASQSSQPATQPAIDSLGAGPLGAAAARLHRQSAGSASVASMGSAPPSEAGGELVSEVEELRQMVAQLREHAHVLEDLLERKVRECIDLRAEVDRLSGTSQQASQQLQRSTGPPLPVLDLSAGCVASDAPTPTMAGRPQAGGGSSASSSIGLTRVSPMADELRDRLHISRLSGGSQQQQPSQGGWGISHMSSGSSTPSQGSPMRQRPGGSPSKAAHRRQQSAPQAAAMFSDLNPIGSG